MEPPTSKAVRDAIDEGKLSRKDACNPPKWFSEIACLGKFAIKGGIHPDRIKRIYDPDKMGSIML